MVGAITCLITAWFSGFLLTEDPVSPSPEQIAPQHRLLVASIIIGAAIGVVVALVTWRRRTGPNADVWTILGWLAVVVTPSIILLGSWFATDGAVYGYVNSNLAEHEVLDRLRVERATVDHRTDLGELLGVSVNPAAGFTPRTSVAYVGADGVAHPVHLRSFIIDEPRTLSGSVADPYRPGRTCRLDLSPSGIARDMQQPLDLNGDGAGYDLLVDCDRTLVPPPND